MGIPTEAYRNKLMIFVINLFFLLNKNTAKPSELAIVKTSESNPIFKEKGKLLAIISFTVLPV
tara:strand:+ start:574 stop:762 length:189 start_codon:yes stop_codon:yes gene_type:complete